MIVDKRIAWVNQRCCDMVGYDAEELTDREPTILYPDRESFERIDRARKEQFTRNGISTLEAKWKRKDGKIVDLLLSSAPLDASDGTGGFTFTALDISERKTAENLIRQSEQTYREIFNASNDVIFIHDLDSGQIIDVNSRIKALYGYEPEAVSEMTLADLSSGTPLYTQEEAVDWLQKTAGEGPQVFEWQAKGKDGKLFWVEVSLKQASIGGVDRLLAVVRDIQARKIAERELLDYRHHLEEMVRRRTAEVEAKNKELETFTYSVSP